VLERVNRQLLAESPSGMFITSIYAILSLDTGDLIYTNAGHNRPIHRHAENGMVELLPKGGIALGVLERIQLPEYSVKLAPGDSLLFYTDGVTESFSPSGEMFGEERLVTLLTNQEYADMCCLLDYLDHTLIEFRGNTPPSDDVTLLAVQREK
jgi:sigma-B regulation protein RsbU (phosphoserine phosphatase)